MSDPIRGTTVECLEHFTKTHHDRLEKDRCRVRKKLCGLLKFNQIMGYRCFGKNMVPIGINLARLRYFLECCGYTVIETENLTEMHREIVRQLVLGVVDPNILIGCAGVRPQSVGRWCIASSSPAINTEAAIRQVLSVNTDNADTKDRALRNEFEKMGLTHNSSQSKSSGSEKFDPVVIKRASSTSGEHFQTVSPIINFQTNGVSRGNIIDILAHLILATKPLVEEILSDAHSSAEREELRQKTTVIRSDGIFELSNLLHRLCSERARKEIVQPK